VGERDGVELERPRLGEELVPAERGRQRVVGAARVRHVDDVLERGQPGPNRADLLAAVDMPVAPAVAGDREKDGRLELAEPVEDAAGPELGRARRPDSAEAGGGEEGDERLGDVREVRDDPVAPTDAEPLEPRGLSPARAGRRTSARTVARLRARDDRDRVDVPRRAQCVSA
jgi:hypothetical protein